ncbi:type VII secretion protein EssC [Streptococcus ferus]|uniref:type VII secretion protein EssC n=1 Tax=Streptococcus ferus TaxID=1345 RepID=UPI003515A1D6
MEIIALKGTYRQILSVPEEGSLILNDQLSVFLEEGELKYQYESENGRIDSGVHLGDFEIYIRPEQVKCYSISGKNRIVIGTEAGRDLNPENPDILLVLSQSQDQSWELQCLGEQVYLNNHLTPEKAILGFGSEIAFGDSMIKVFPKEVWLSGTITNERLLEVAVSMYHYYEDYPDYHRSPRLIYRPIEDKVTVNAPPQVPNKPRNELLRMLIPPLIMVGIVVLISIFQPRGLYIFMSVAMGITTAVFSVQNYFRNKRDYKQSLEDRISAYHAYLADKSIELTQLAESQRFGQYYHYPNLEEIDELAQGYSHRIYEKIPQQFDFLYYRLGLGQVPPSYQLMYSQKERSGVKDPLEVEGFELYESHKTLNAMPVIANLQHGPVGYVGDRSLVLEQLQLLVHQLAFFHSYHDVQFIVVMPEHERPQWEWLRWLPHATLRDLNIRGFVDNQRTRDQVLGSLNQILKQRQTQLAAAGSNQEIFFTPHYVILITDETLVMDHVIMEFFSEDPTALGCSLIFVQDVMRSLSENVQTVIRLKDQTTGELVMEEGILKEQNFTLDHFPEAYDKEQLARRLAPLRHLQTLKSSIPESVTFLEMYGAEKVSDLDILSRWQSRRAYQSMAVPLGLRGQDDIVNLDLHEKAHGPHGLIAGTTGSGKSELIQSYILSLAVNFHPHEVAFLLIDYKGGGMANLFKDLPHVLGTITNLDGAQSMRALTSIKAELQRRQRLFAQYHVNHIHAYQKKVQLGEAKEPMPHLFLISDEFAELKSEQPEFISELISTARIGRSLGVNLILATQKPTGVVNDQIWSNSNFRIALKVADKSDSQEMLHTPDAAEITQTGRAYLQVGNNEVYELFQSAWSGADYQLDKDSQGIADYTISRINALGQYEALNKDLSGLDQATSISQVPTELNAIVEEIERLTQEEKIVPLPQPWLPPLEERIYLPNLRQPNDHQVLWSIEKQSIKAILGLIDIPSRQKQEVLEHDFVEDGNIILIASPTMGKSTFLQTITLDLAQQYTPENIQFYLIDFGTNGLLTLQQLPHVADYITIDDTEKIDKFIRLMKGSIDQRKQLFSSHSVSGLKMYEEVVGKSLPHLFIIIDSYDGIKETTLTMDLEALFLTLSREGVSLGIHLVITASRQGSLKPSLLATLKRRISLKLTEDSETRTFIGGRLQVTLEDIPGRGMIYYNQPEIFQVALPVFGKSDFELNQNLKQMGEILNNAWTGDRPKRIPIVPNVLTAQAFREKESVQKGINNGYLPIGLDFLQVEHVGIKLIQLTHLLVFGENNSSTDRVIHHLLLNSFTLTPNTHTVLVDGTEEYREYYKDTNVYIGSDMIADFVPNMLQEIKDRKDQRKSLHTLIIIPNILNFIEMTNCSMGDFTKLYNEGPRYGLHFVIVSQKTTLLKNDAIIKHIRDNIEFAIVAQRLYDQNFVRHNQTSREQKLKRDEVYLYQSDSTVKTKITK